MFVRFRSVGVWLGSVAGYVAVIGVATVVIATACDRLLDTWAQDKSARDAAAPVERKPSNSTNVRPSKVSLTSASQATVIRSASLIPTSDDWAAKLADPAFWAKLKSGKSSSMAAQRSSLGGSSARSPGKTLNDDILPSSHSAQTATSRHYNSDGDETYRTVCVRACDGAFFPISFSTSRDQFDADAAKCEKTCPGARLFFHRNPGADLEDLEDLDGKPYKKLTTAFRFRTTYDASCKCRAHPWDEASRTQHRVYALEEAKSRGDKAAAREVLALATKLKQAEFEAAADRKRIEKERLAEAKAKAEQAKREEAAKKAARVAEAKAAAERRAAEAKAAREAKLAAKSGQTIKASGARQDGPAVGGSQAMARPQPAPAEAPVPAPSPGPGMMGLGADLPREARPHR